MKSLIFLVLGGISYNSLAAECRCDIYPFYPNPPCFASCVEYLTENKNIDLSYVKDLDPAVYESIAFLRSTETTSRMVDLEAVHNPQQLFSAEFRVRAYDLEQDNNSINTFEK